MMKFRTRLIFGLLLTVFFVLASLGFIIGQVLKGFYIDELKQRLAKEASLSAYMLEDVEEEDWGQFAEVLAEELNVRVTILNSDGETAAETAENTSSNTKLVPEIKNAGENGGSNIRYNPGAGDELLFYAYPFQYGDGDKGFIRFSLPVERLDNINKQIWLFIGISFSIAFIIILSLSYRIASQLTRPIGQAKEVALELAKGNFSARVEESSKDEIGQLAWSINTLAHNLEKISGEYHIQSERLEALIDHMGSGLIFIDDRGDIALINQYCKDIFNTNTDKWRQQLYHEVIGNKEIIQLIQEIFLTENKVRSTVQLENRLPVQHYEVFGAPVLGTKDKLRGVVLVFHDITDLKKLEQVRKDFVANVSHELKTPVTSLKGFAETLLGGAMKDEKASEQFLEIIWKESDRLQHLINDLLELSKIEKLHFQLNKQTVNLTELIDETRELLREKAREREIEIFVKYEDTLKIQGDGLRLKQILINLINNAIVYTPQEGFITVKLREAGNMAHITIEDTGIGMKKNELPRIFERFYRVDKDRSRNSGGTGLGLAIVKHLVEAHDGEIIVSSEEGIGTTFDLYFPFESASNKEQS